MQRSIVEFANLDTVTWQFNSLVDRDRFATIPAKDRFSRPLFGLPVNFPRNLASQAAQFRVLAPESRSHRRASDQNTGFGIALAGGSIRSDRSMADNAKDDEDSSEQGQENGEKCNPNGDR